MPEKCFAFSPSFCPLCVVTEIVIFWYRQNILPFHPHFARCVSLNYWNGYPLVTPKNVFFLIFTHILPTVFHYWNWYLLVLPRFDFLATCFRDCCFAVADIKTSHHWKPILVESYVLFGQKMWREIVEKGKRKGLKYLRKEWERERKSWERGERGENDEKG